MQTQFLVADRIDFLSFDINFVIPLPYFYFLFFAHRELKVLYGGTEIFDYEVSQSIEHDAYLAIDSAWLVLVLMFVLTGFSFFSTVTGIATILSCFPLAYLFYNVVFGFKTMGFLNISSLFVIIGIGVDDVFVYLNTFKQSKELKGLGDSVERRLAHTIIVAGKATFFTSITTSAAFFANAVSQVCFCAYVCTYT